MWTISINWHRWLLVNNHISKYNSFILVLYRRYINYVYVCPPPPILAPFYATALLLLHYYYSYYCTTTTLRLLLLLLLLLYYDYYYYYYYITTTTTTTITTRLLLVISNYVYSYSSYAVDERPESNKVYSVLTLRIEIGRITFLF